MYRHNLTRPVEADGISISTIFLRRPTRADQAAIVAAGMREQEARGRPLGAVEISTLMIAQIAELPPEAVRKLAVSDARALAVRVKSMFAAEGMR